MQEKIKKLGDRIQAVIKTVGEPYCMFFDEKERLYKGCFAPLYHVYPHLPKYTLPSDDPSNNYDYGMFKIARHAHKINKSEIRGGDFLVTRYKNELHVALILDKFKILHVFRNHTTQIDRLTFFKEDRVRFYRINEE